MGESADLVARLERYLELTGRAIKTVTIVPPPRSFLRKGAEDFLAMARSYYEDSLAFRKEGDLPKSLAAVSYAHGWIDAGVRMGLLYGGDDEKTFTQYV